MKRELIEHRLFFAEGHDGDAFHLALEHAAHAGGQHGRIAVGGTDQDFVAVGYGNLFEALDQLREERIGDVLNDDAEEAAAPGDERARMGVGEIIQLLDRLPDTLGELLTYDGRAIDGARDGGDGDFGQCGYSPNVGRFIGALCDLLFEPRANPEYSRR